MNLPERPEIGIYKTKNGYIVEVFALFTEYWGMHGKYLTGPLKNNIDVWIEKSLNSWVCANNPTIEGFSIVERIDKNKFPEYFL